eukprot:gene1694-3284_t
MNSPHVNVSSFHGLKVATTEARSMPNPNHAVHYSGVIDLDATSYSEYDSLYKNILPNYSFPNLLNITNEKEFHKPDNKSWNKFYQESIDSMHNSILAQHSCFDESFVLAAMYRGFQDTILQGIEIISNEFSLPIPLKKIKPLSKTIHDRKTNKTSNKDELYIHKVLSTIIDYYGLRFQIFCPIPISEDRTLVYGTNSHSMLIDKLTIERKHFIERLTAELGSEIICDNNKNIQQNSTTTSVLQLLHIEVPDSDDSIPKFQIHHCEDNKYYFLNL